ncbi:hypothetical protein [Gilvimarinus sp. DA14]|uniref:hypothetical protein n=1 Tax=Gilvimarinus sp. DA14 TaxID=2956798 RepID=UPI0020B6C729|nr:hypothetical protein [Gilvimarinus sp. DA14]UTF60679.1 hypothetical protein NHM04_02440 [Gilvimarinus sp. DA14]
MNNEDQLGSEGNFVPFFQPQGSLLPGNKGIDISAFAFVPNALYQADKAKVSTPSTITMESDNVIHITLPLKMVGSIESPSDFQGRPVSWALKDIELDDGITHVAIHVIGRDQIVLNSRIVALDSTSASKKLDVSTQKLSALEDAVSKLGNGGLEPIQLLKKMKDSGF